MSGQWMRFSYGKLGAIVGLLFILLAVFSLTVVETGQMAVVTRSGSEQIRVITEPGIYGRLPFVERVVLIDARFKTSEQHAVQAYATADQKTLQLAGWVMWRVSNPIQFNTTTTAGKNPVDEKLLKLFSESLAAWVAGQSAATILHLQNDSADQRWLADLNQRLEPLGVQAASVGLRQVGLSEAATEKIYERMSAVRTRTSRQLIDGMVNDERQLTALQSRQQAQVLDDAYRAAQQTRKSAESQLLTAYARQYGGSNSFAAALNDSPRATGKSDQ